MDAVAPGLAQLIASDYGPTGIILNPADCSASSSCSRRPSRANTPGNPAVHDGTPPVGYPSSSPTPCR
jgi:hypothetical protein